MIIEKKPQYKFDVELGSLRPGQLFRTSEYDAYFLVTDLSFNQVTVVNIETG